MIAGAGNGQTRESSFNLHTSIADLRVLALLPAQFRTIGMAWESRRCHRRMNLAAVFSHSKRNHARARQLVQLSKDADGSATHPANSQA